jgi:hypothetical protein
MEEKYYTPSIEEFHVGFEFEQLVRLRKGGQTPIETKEWINKIVFPNIPIYSGKGYEDYIYRVKYLDQEDIESLGGEVNSWSNVDGGGMIYNFSKFCLFLHDGFRLSITIPSLNIHTNKGFYHHTVFDGEIKNKSELKRVLKMIGYK